MYKFQLMFIYILHIHRFPEYQRSPHTQVKSQPHKPRAVYPKDHPHPVLEIYPYNGMGNNRSEKIQHLRENYQRKHQERQGRYPHEEREDLYEKRLQDLERRVCTFYNSHSYSFTFLKIVVT